MKQVFNPNVAHHFTVFAAVEYRDDTIKMLVFEIFFYSAALSAVSSSLQVYLFAKRGNIGEYDS